ncbi:S-layer homology domain-containing protein [Paenibacillus sp. Marseille-Q4541]|uniref:S-layer homology domain-containing protein n=1 Tax=Paenibacillus sp. Marseille-Q4541 TaxID=2831522 RepID=UPI001BA74917|nr:S-layer homology domain-containing protein [Paenibacillus sp. Marseille-Q4541]
MPDGNVTREQLAVMLVRAWKLTHKDNIVMGTTEYKDSHKISSWVQASVGQATALHLLKGQTNGNFSPKGLVTRAEAAQAIHNLLETL